MTEYTHGARITWASLSFTTHKLEAILNAEFPDWKKANFFEDFNGQTMYVLYEVVVFKTADQATMFILKYGKELAMEPAQTIRWHDIEKF